MPNKCPLCCGNFFNLVLERNNCPVLQNKLYDSEDDAKKAVVGNLRLVQCKSCGFTFNQTHEENLSQYDTHYQNEQACSPRFREHLNDIVAILESQSFNLDKVLEIGCGKGFFLDLLLERGHDIYGFDPAYEGDNDRIRKEYYGIGSHFIAADTIILRHTLEHIKDPFQFLHQIASANGYNGRVYIEVPCFDWIAKNNAFWDIFYEHINYFTAATLKSMFAVADTGRLFGGQYLYLVAELKNLRKSLVPQLKAPLNDTTVFNRLTFQYSIWAEKLKDTIVWGAGAKGVTFVNLIDHDRKLFKGIIDINPDKQGKYVASSGHKVFSTDILQKEQVQNIIIMNDNYYEEIEKFVSGMNIHLHIIGANW